MMKILGIFGHPVAHSLSPKMHGAALKALQLDEEYAFLPFDILPENLAEGIKALRVLNARGICVTIPHKEKVAAFLDQIDPLAQAIGAVNVIVNQQGVLQGYNTDGSGFLRSLKEDAGADPRGKRIVVLGAGGASRAVTAFLAKEGAGQIDIINRSGDKAEVVAEMVRSLGAPCRAFSFSDPMVNEVITAGEIIINTTSLGLHPGDLSPLHDFADCLHPGQLVCDIIYNPKETVLLRQAKAAGCDILYGLGMLLYQGVEAFRLWTGEEAPVEIMREVLIKST